jgi:hypothetical protein
MTGWSGPISPTEDDLLSPFADLERAGLAFTFHVRDARGQRLAGLPDVICIVPSTGRVGMFELKTQRDRVSARQRAVMAALSCCHAVVSGIVRPVPRVGEISLDEALALLVGDDTDR